MNSMDVEVIRTAMDWMNRGHRVVLGKMVGEDVEHSRNAGRWIGCIVNCHGRGHAFQPNVLPQRHAGGEVVLTQ
jgi:hypothetical protein